MVKCAKVRITPNCVSSADEIPPSVSHGPAVTDDEDVESGQPLHIRPDGYSPLSTDAVSVHNYVASKPRLTKL